MSAPRPQGRFFDQEIDDLATDFPFLEPLAGIPGLPPVSAEYIEYARVIEAQETGTPLAETGRSRAVRS